MKNFALIGAAGYIAPRHIQAIKDTDNNLIAAYDPHDAVGILDRYFDDVSYFRELERFDRHIEKLRLEKNNDKIDYISICSPNYLHDSHIRFGLKAGANVICEKPLVINPWNVDLLAELEQNYNSKVFTVLQLRVHPSIIALKKKIDEGPKDKVYEIDLSYFTSRGPWYHFSWKGDISKSGGLATNIGVHFFDMLSWIFGDIQHNEVHLSSETVYAGFLKFTQANVKWILCIDKKKLPKIAVEKGMTTYRSITIDGDEVEFSEGFTDLHTIVYRDILQGKGYGVRDSRQAIQIVHDIRKATPTGINLNSHHLLSS